MVHITSSAISLLTGLIIYLSFCSALSRQCERVLLGHSDCVMALAPLQWSTENTHSFLASGSRDLTVIIWDLVTGMPVRTLEGHTATVTSLCIPDVMGRLNTPKPKPIDRAYSYQKEVRTKCGAKCGAETLQDSSQGGAHGISILIDSSKLGDGMISSVEHGEARLMADEGLSDGGHASLSPGDRLESKELEKSSCGGNETCSSVVLAHRLLSGSYDNTVKVWDLDRIIRDYR
jgi:WD40 repeat protein